MRQNQQALPKSEPESVPGPELHTQITVLARDIETLTELAITRFPSVEAEINRIAEIGFVLRVATDLQRAQDLYTHYVLVDHRGTRGSHDTRSAGHELFSALQAYADALRGLAGRYKGLPAPAVEKDHAESEELDISFKTVSRHATNVL